MTHLSDELIIDIPAGSLLFPSSLSEGRSGNYYLEDIMGFLNDDDVFPAVLLPNDCPTFARILTPTGVHVLARFALVSCVRSQ